MVTSMSAGDCDVILSNQADITAILVRLIECRASWLTTGWLTRVVGVAERCCGSRSDKHI